MKPFLRQTRLRELVIGNWSAKKCPPPRIEKGGSAEGMCLRVRGSLTEYKLGKVLAASYQRRRRNAGISRFVGENFGCTGSRGGTCRAGTEEAGSF